MTAEIAQLEDRVTRLEAQITAGFLRMEDLLRQRIDDLKDEQIADLKAQMARLADDQRRLWDALHAMQLRDSQRAGGSKMLAAIGHFLSAGLGGFVTWLVTWLSGGTPPHHP